MTVKPAKLLTSDWMIGGLLTLVFLAGYLGDWKLLRTMEYFTYDVRAHLRENPKPTDQIVIVGVDDDSLTKVGRWPWPRSVIAQLIEQLKAGGAKVIGVGFLFSEPEQPQGVAELRTLREKFPAQAEALTAGAGPRGPDPRLQDLYGTIQQELSAAESRLDQDGKLAAVIKETPQVILPMYFEIGKPQYPP